jgi:RNase P subunit RPR2
VDCAYCERPLICDHCQTPYIPPTAEHYAALSRSEVPVYCLECERVLVCHWCKTPYDGGAGEDESDGPAALEG